MKLEHYGFVGDLNTAALVGDNGSVDWLCLPRFDAQACLAALLGTPANGRWLIAPAESKARSRQRYRPETLVLESEFECEHGAIRIIDFMPPADGRHDLIRIVEGVRGRVRVQTELVVRFDYGKTIPWVRRVEDGTEIVAGPDALVLRTDVPLHGQDLTTVGEFEVAAGTKHTFVLTWFRSHETPPPPLDADRSLRETERFWTDWCAQCRYRGPWREAVVRSLITLKGLTYQPTGGIVAAPTTSLPEKIGGVRNWDYRYCWIRDATFTLYSLLEAGFQDEARAWSDWLLRAAAGDPSQLQMLYGPAGERWLPEFELPHLPGYEDSRPVRIGNAATGQFQLDVYGEIMDVALLKRQAGLPIPDDSWHMQRHLVEFVIRHWQDDDEGIWETRGRRRPFTHSKIMAWVALDRAVKCVERFGVDGDLDRWKAARERIHAEVCTRGYDDQRGVFTWFYGSPELDASLLMIPLVGFLPVQDPRVVRTVHAIRRELTVDGLVRRYPTGDSSPVDGLPPGEGAFLPCSFWLVDCLYLLGEIDEARALFERLLGLRTPLGLLSEEYDTTGRRLVGNFPQAFSHVALINSAQNLSEQVHPAEERSGEDAPAARRPARSR